MKHPFRDRLLILICALALLCGAAGAVAFLAGKVTLDCAAALIASMQAGLTLKQKVILGAAAAVAVLYALLLLGVILPSRKKKLRSSNFAYQQNENGMVRISLKTLEALVHRCLSQHEELKVVSSSLFSDEESVQVDVHITLQSDISMPLAVSALQKQIKKYLEACSGVVVQEVRVYVDGAMPVSEKTAKSPYAIPASMLGLDTELPTIEEAQAEAAVFEEAAVEAETEAAEENVEQADEAAETAEETVAAEEPQAEVKEEEVN